MIQINLLPHREAAKKVRKETFMASCVLSAIAGAAIAGGIYLFFQTLITDQENANRMIEQENARLKDQIKEVANIEAEIAALKARQEAVENLQSERNLPVELLNEVVRETPNGSYVTSLNKTAKTVALTGVAQSNQTVADLLRNIGDEMPWDSRPQLVETKAAKINLGAKRERQAFGYSLSFGLNKKGADEESDGKK
ncbi:MAG: PilN domain-containing protein [Comamonadaceae bacterium]|nr:PilN domain-containing protein [Comamonadaceae bacterium]